MLQRSGMSLSGYDAAHEELKADAIVAAASSKMALSA